MAKIIGVLALQGAFIEHERAVSDLGAQVREIRSADDLIDMEKNGISGLILPGGESTVQGKLLRDLNIFEKMRSMIVEGLPVLGTCAGMILLADEISGTSEAHLRTLPVRVRRNAYGRQLGSFIHHGKVKGIGDVSMNFIRAPFIETVLDPEVEVLSEVDSKIVAAEYRNILALSFHPEVTEERQIHKYFLEKC